MGDRKSERALFKAALIDTLPVMSGYIVLGIGFGMIMKSAGYSIAMAAAMSLLIYAGSMQYAAVGLLTGGASFLTVILTTVMVNARHLFYGISMLDKYRDTGIRKPYLIFSLTDETYSLVCGDVPGRDHGEQTSYRFYVSLLDQCYWVLGSIAGAVAGTVLSFNSKGIDFALTALFLTVFLDQWMHTRDHGPALIGVGASVLSLLLFGASSFLLPAMIMITAALILKGRREVS
ncbi:MAG: AzlC family ABC transporter permease [Lachnospiraceae bacterium]|nr:AzlC family ABC transporter permease [Lachnospiraceae bacterium]